VESVTVEVPALEAGGTTALLYNAYGTTTPTDLTITGADPDSGLDSGTGGSSNDSGDSGTSDGS
jgi:hypothetical protein